MTKETKYQGIVKDRLGTLGERKTRYYATYEEAHKAAEKLCRKSWGDRATINVEMIIPDRPITELLK